MLLTIKCKEMHKVFVHLVTLVCTVWSPHSYNRAVALESGSWPSEAFNKFRYPKARAEGYHYLPHRSGITQLSSAATSYSAAVPGPSLSRAQEKESPSGPHNSAQGNWGWESSPQRDGGTVDGGGRQDRQAGRQAEGLRVGDTVS